MNLPNAITIARIAATPFVAALPFMDAWEWRLAAFVLFIITATTDYVDGVIARSRNLVTDLGRLLDPLADKLLLLGTFVPMFLLVGSAGSWSIGTPHMADLVAGVLGPMSTGDSDSAAFPFVTPIGRVGFPWWIIVVILGREAAMTVFRYFAVRRGLVIGAIGPAKWKTGLQWTWVGATYFWFFAATLAAERAWTGGAWRAFAYFNGIVGTVTMVAATLLTLYSLLIYVRRYGPVFRAAGRSAAGYPAGR